MLPFVGETSLGPRSPSGIVSHEVVRERLPWTGWGPVSGCQGRQADDGIIAERGDGFQGHVTGSLDGPFVVLFEQDGADQSNQGVLIGEDADHVGTAFHLLVEALQRIGIG